MSIAKKKNKNVEMIAYRFAGIPDDESRNMIAKTHGCVRYLYNRMLSDHTFLYDHIGSVPDNTPADYKDLEECSWLKEVDSLALANAQVHLDTAFENFFKKRADYPKFKKKNKKNSYTTNMVNDNIKFDEKTGLLKLPKIKSAIQLKVHRKIKPNGLLKSVTVTKEPDGKYYFSLLFEYPLQEIKPKSNFDNSIGLDMSLPKLYIDSNGNEADFIKPYRRLERRIAIEQRKLSNMTKGSKNYEKQKLKLAKLHAKIKHQRKDMLHKLSTMLTNKYNIICIEDLDMRAIKRALRFGKSVSDNGWGMFVTMLEYKAKRKGGTLVKVNKWFASSKTCSKCGHVHKELKLSDRIYECPVCENLMDRDHQAAINIRNEGLRLLKEAA